MKASPKDARGPVLEAIAMVLVPTALLVAVVRGRAIRAAVTDAFDRRRRERRGPWTDAPSIEQLATDLRRLLRQHDVVLHSSDGTLRGRKLQAIDLAIANCARDACRALDVPCELGPAEGATVPRGLRPTLRALAEAGLVLPPTAELLAGDGEP